MGVGVGVGAGGRLGRLGCRLRWPRSRAARRLGLGLRQRELALRRPRPRDLSAGASGASGNLSCTSVLRYPRLGCLGRDRGRLGEGARLQRLALRQGLAGASGASPGLPVSPRLQPRVTPPGPQVLGRTRGLGLLGRDRRYLGRLGLRHSGRRWRSSAGTSGPAAQCLLGCRLGCHAGASGVSSAAASGTHRISGARPKPPLPRRLRNGVGATAGTSGTCASTSGVCSEAGGGGDGVGGEGAAGSRGEVSSVIGIRPSAGRRR